MYLRQANLSGIIDEAEVTVNWNDIFDYKMFEIDWIMQQNDFIKDHLNDLQRVHKDELIQNNLITKEYLDENPQLEDAEGNIDLDDLLALVDLDISALSLYQNGYITIQDFKKVTLAELKSLKNIPVIYTEGIEKFDELIDDVMINSLNQLADYLLELKEQLGEDSILTQTLFGTNISINGMLQITNFLNIGQYIKFIHILIIIRAQLILMVQT